MISEHWSVIKYALLLLQIARATMLFLMCLLYCLKIKYKDNLKNNKLFKSMIAERECINHASEWIDNFIGRYCIGWIIFFYFLHNVFKYIVRLGYIYFSIYVPSINILFFQLFSFGLCSNRAHPQASVRFFPHILFMLSRRGKHCYSTSRYSKNRL